MKCTGDFTAEDAAKISRVKAPTGWGSGILPEIKEAIIKAANSGKFEVRIHKPGKEIQNYSNTVVEFEYDKFLNSRGFRVYHDICCDENYHGTTIKWGK